MVKDINPNGSGVTNHYLTTRVAIGNTLFFVANDGVRGQELWKTDGNATGTVMLADINPGIASSDPSNLTAFNGKVYFTATGAASSVLWVTDGTAAGTTVFHNITMTNFVDPENLNTFQVSGGRLYYRTTNDGLWSTDGTQAGTVPTEFWPLAAVNGQVLYAHSDAEHGEELWIGDGTLEGTSLLADIWLGASSSYLHEFIVVG